ncbi:hypothetical protein GSI_03012 [Ganoderma sinense ZZ0214-1]|uniref:Uncharacterized protein n=1 Tax=Ganoderma sinense ZZ0214-1 TaxID=1077348 RepID=A0A2G8SN80_9APHY|nr:hypothetical protein GSI_03012 [Ganoderma sinense ZZ0214-1]
MPAAVQSTLVVQGFFQLCNPSRVKSPRRTDPSVSTFHYKYDTALQCVDNSGLSAKVRFFSPPGNVPITERTVCFMEAKAFISRHRGPVFLEGIRLAPVPGDPTSDDYQSNVPDLTYGLIHAIGIVQDVSSDARAGQNRHFRLQLQPCVMPAAVARWRNIRLPHVNTGVYISGVCGRIRDNGMLEVTLDDILFNLLVAPSMATDDELSPTSAPPAKRQKFDAMAFAPRFVFFSFVSSYSFLSA